MNAVGTAVKVLNGSSPMIVNCILESNINQLPSGQSGRGGAMFIVNSSPTMLKCHFSHNSVRSGFPGPAQDYPTYGHWDIYSEGGAVFVGDCSSQFSLPTFEDCIFSNNSAESYAGWYLWDFLWSDLVPYDWYKGNVFAEGGAISTRTSIIISNCSFVSNLAVAGNSTGDEFSAGSAVYNESSSVEIANNIFAFNSNQATAVDCGGYGTYNISCTDVYGNGEDWVGCIADQAEINGNFSADPLFCDTANGDFHISSYSPCAPSYNSCGELIGVLDVACTYNYLCGDIVLDNEANIADVVYLIDYYFNGGPPPPQIFNGDLNCDGVVGLVDIVFLNQHVLHNGDADCCP